MLDTLVPILKDPPFVGKEVLEFAAEAQEPADKILTARDMLKKSCRDWYILTRDEKSCKL